MCSATRIIASTFGVIMSLAGLEHGVGEILQGSNPPPGIMFASWPGSETFALMAGEPAMSLIPNLLVSGVMTVLLSVFTLIWSLAFLGGKYGGRVLLLLSLFLLLVGGGIAPPLMGMIVGAAATRIHNPLRRWNDREPGSNPPLLAKFWHVFTVAGVLGYLALLPGIPIAMRFIELEDPAIVSYLGLFSFMALLLAVIAGLAWDSYQSGQMETNRVPS